MCAPLEAHIPGLAEGSDRASRLSRVERIQRAGGPRRRTIVDELAQETGSFGDADRIGPAVTEGRPAALAGSQTTQKQRTGRVAISGICAAAPSASIESPATRIVAPVAKPAFPTVARVPPGRTDYGAATAPSPFSQSNPRSTATRSGTVVVNPPTMFAKQLLGRRPRKVALSLSQSTTRNTRMSTPSSAGSISAAHLKLRHPPAASRNRVLAPTCRLSGRGRAARA